MADKANAGIVLETVPPAEMVGALAADAAKMAKVAQILGQGGEDVLKVALALEGKLDVIVEAYRRNSPSEPSFLPTFDEILRAYKERAAALDRGLD